MGEISGYPIFPQPKAAESHHILRFDFNPNLKFNPNPIPKFGQMETLTLTLNLTLTLKLTLISPYFKV